MKPPRSPHDWDYSTRICRRCDRGMDWAHQDPDTRETCAPADVDRKMKGYALARALRAHGRG